MAETLQRYGVKLEFQEALKSLNKLKQSASNLNKMQENALKRQIALQRQLNTLRNYTPRSQPRNEPVKARDGGSLKQDFVGPTIQKERLALIRREAKAEQQRINSLEKAKATVMRTAAMQKLQTNESEKQFQWNVKNRLETAKTADEVKMIVAQERARTKLYRQQSFLMKRMTSSSQQLAGNMVSAFALAAGGGAIIRTGQNFEAVNNTMLAVSENTEQAGENFEFVQQEAYRLGLGLTESAKGFAKMVAARGEMSLDDTKEAFKGVAEMSTLLGLSADESNRAINALQQMMSKGVVSAEELKLQMGEVMPNAIQLMSKAAKDAGLSINGTVKEMMDLQMQGALTSSKVLPHFAKRMREAAAANGGLKKALDSNRVAMNRMTTSFQMAADTFFKSGFSEGLTDFFNTTSKMIKDNEHLWTALGKIVGGVLKGISFVIKNVVAPVVDAFGSILTFITDILQDFSAVALPAFSPAFWVAASKAMKLGFRGVALALSPLLLKFTLISGAVLILIGLLEEVAEFFSPTGKRTLIGTNINALTDSFDGFISKFGEVLGKVPTTLGGEIDTQKQQDALKIMYGYGYKSTNQAQSGFAPPAAIKVEAPIYIDREKIGEAIMDSENAREAVRREINNSITKDF